MKVGDVVALAVDLPSSRWGEEWLAGTRVEIIEIPSPELVMVIPVRYRNRDPERWFYVIPNQLTEVRRG